MRLSSCVHQFFDRYLPQIKGVSPHTIKTYRDAFKLFIPFAADYHGVQITSLSLDHLSPEVILDFLDHIEKERKNSPRTRNQRLAAIKSLAKMTRFMYPRQAVRMDKIIAIPQKRTQRKLIGFLYPQELHKVLNAVDLKKAQGLRDYTILQLLFESGARASEIANLKLDYFDARQATLAILGKGRRFRQIELSPATARLIKTYIARYRKQPCAPYRHWLFINKQGRPLTRHGIYRLCRKYLRLALPEKRLKVLNPVHSFRHSCAINMLAAGCSLSDIKNHLGHEDIQSTTIYLQLDLSQRKKVQKKFTRYVKSALSENAQIEELIDEENKDEIMKWLDSL